jgi:predicted phosphodiesterase
MGNKKSKPLYSKSTIKFGVISDPQIGDNVQERNKENAISTVIDEKVDFVVFPGDLTSRGFNKVWFNWLVQKLIYNDIIRPSTNYSWVGELDKFIKLFIKPLEDKNIKTFSIRGNHDTYTGPIHPVKNWIKKKHCKTCLSIGKHLCILNGGINYKVNLHDKLDMICIDIYPNKKNSDWLKKHLDNNKSTIIVFHYPLKGPYSDKPWWTDEEKTYFYNIIKDSKIKLLCVGHFHKSEIYEWKDIKVVNGGGNQVGIVEIDLDNDNIDIKLV